MARAMQCAEAKVAMLSGRSWKFIIGNTAKASLPGV